MPDGELTLDTDWTLTLQGGLEGVVGNLGLEPPLEEKFTRTDRCKLRRHGSEGQRHRSRREAAARSSRSRIRSPSRSSSRSRRRSPGFPQGCHAMSDAPAGVSCSGQFEALTDYTITVDAAQPDVFGQKLDKPQVIDVPHDRREADDLARVGLLRRRAQAAGRAAVDAQRDRGRRHRARDHAGELPRAVAVARLVGITSRPTSRRRSS